MHITVWKLAYTVAEPLGATPCEVSMLARAIAADRNVPNGADLTRELLTDVSDIAIARELAVWLAPHIGQVEITRDATLDGERAGMLTVTGDDRWETASLCDRLAENLNWIYAHTVYSGDDGKGRYQVVAKYRV